MGGFGSSRILITVLVVVLACGFHWRQQVKIALTKAALDSTTHFTRQPHQPADGCPSSSCQVIEFMYRYIMGSKQPQQTVQQVRTHLHSITSKNPVINNLDLAEADVVRTAVPAPFRKHHVKRLEFRRWC